MLSFELSLLSSSLLIPTQSVCLSENCELQLPWRLLCAVENANILTAEASRPEDKLKLVSAIKHGVGIQRMQTVLCDVFKTAFRSSLRW